MMKYDDNTGDRRVSGNVEPELIELGGEKSSFFESQSQWELGRRIPNSFRVEVGDST